MIFSTSRQLIARKAFLWYIFTMSLLFLSLVLVVLINLPVPMRAFVHSHIHNAKKTDYFTVLPLISFIICILLFFVYGFTWSILFATVITFFIGISNVERFYRFCSHLNRAPFSVGFIAVSIIQTILLLGFFVVLCVFCPSFVNTKVSKTVAFSGSNVLGYEPKGMSLSTTDAKLTIYEGAHNDFGFSKNKDKNKKKITAKNEASENMTSDGALADDNMTQSDELSDEAEKSLPAVLFISDIFTDTSDSIGTLSYLAEKGYQVYAFSFYDRKLSYFNNWKDFYVIFKSFMRYENMTNPDNFDEKYDIISRFNYDKYKSCMEIMTEMGVEKFFILADGFCISPANQIMTENPDKVLEVYNINHDNKIEGYVDGHGNLSATRPLEWTLLGYKMNRRWDDAKRIAFYADKKFKLSTSEEK